MIRVKRDSYIDTEILLPLQAQWTHMNSSHAVNAVLVQGLEQKTIA